MSNPHLNTRAYIQSACIQTTAWVHDNRPEVVSLLSFRVNQNHQAYAEFSIYPTSDEIIALITNLEQHLHHIKTCEIELLAQQTQAEAA